MEQVWQKETDPTLQFYVIVLPAVMVMLNTLPWCRRSRSFVVLLRCCENTPDAGLEDEGQVWSLLSTDSLLEGDCRSNLFCCPLVFA